MESKIELNGNGDSTIITVVTAINGLTYRILVSDYSNFITITTTEGEISIEPKTSNQVKIKTNLY